MSAERGFGIERSEVGADDEYSVFSEYDLPAYVGTTSFQKLPLIADDALAEAHPDVAIVGAPFDDGTSFRPGARFGPRAIRQASCLSGDLYSIQLESSVLDHLACVDAGDAPIVPSRPSRGLSVIHQKVGRVVKAGAIPVVLGGDHSISYPSVAAVSGAVGSRVGVVHFDAHADTGRDVWGSLISHGTPMRNLIEERWISGRNFVQVGLHGYWPERETFDWMREQGMRWHRMVEIEDRGIDAVTDDAIEEALEGADRVYLSLDIDVVDPGSAPGTGTPEPGGLQPRELLRAVRRIAGRVELAGMDVVEVAPPYDHAEVTAMLAHRCILEVLSVMAASRTIGSAGR